MNDREKLQAIKGDLENAKSVLFDNYPENAFVKHLYEQMVCNVFIDLFEHLIYKNFKLNELDIVNEIIALGTIYAENINYSNKKEKKFVDSIKDRVYDFVEEKFVKLYRYEIDIGRSSNVSANIFEIARNRLNLFIIRDLLGWFTKHWCLFDSKYYLEFEKNKSKVVEKTKYIENPINTELENAIKELKNRIDNIEREEKSITTISDNKLNEKLDKIHNAYSKNNKDVKRVTKRILPISVLVALITVFGSIITTVIVKMDFSFSDKINLTEHAIFDRLDDRINRDINIYIRCDDKCKEKLFQDMTSFRLNSYKNEFKRLCNTKDINKLKEDELIKLWNDVHTGAYKSFLLSTTNHGIPSEALRVYIKIESNLSSKIENSFIEIMRDDIYVGVYYKSYTVFYLYMNFLDTYFEFVSNELNNINGELKGLKYKNYECN